MLKKPAPVATPKQNHRRRKQVRAFIGLLCAVLAGIYWFFVPPTSGGGQPDGFWARRVKNQVYASINPRDEVGFARLTEANLPGWHGAFAEPVQTFQAYRRLRPVRPTASRRTIVLQPIGPFDAERTRLLSELRDFCAAYYQLPVRIAPPLGLEICTATRPSRVPNPKAVAGNQQYSATDFIGLLAQRLPDDAVVYLGVTMADLWGGGLNFVFGQGSAITRTGVYSLCRYYPEFWNRPRHAGDEKIALRRACQVLAHESGHMFGLPHCVFYRCVMNGSVSLSDADGSPLDFCPVCRQKMLWNLGCDGAKRYADLLAFYRRHGLTKEVQWTAARLLNWRKIEKQ